MHLLMGYFTWNTSSICVCVYKHNFYFASINEDRTSCAWRTKTGHNRRSAIIFFCNCCIFAMCRVCLLYCVFFYPGLFFYQNRQLIIYDRGMKALFSCLEMMLSTLRYCIEKWNRIIFLCYRNNMVLLVFKDILLYNVHSNQKWKIFHRLKFEDNYFGQFSAGSVCFSMIKHQIVNEWTHSLLYE